MPLDPQLDAVLQLLNNSGAPALSAGTPESARQGFRFMTVDLRDPANLAPVRSTHDVLVPGGEGDRPARIYRPEVEGPVPTVVFFHGGGYVIGDIETHDDHARLICHEVGAVVISVDYRLAPEHPFPAGLEDCLAAYRHVAANIEQYGGNPSQLAVAGDSAGGNLAAATAIACRDAGLPLAAQLLLYPGVDFRDSELHASRAENAEGFFLTADDMRWFGSHYLQDVERAEDPRATLLLQPDLSGLAPAVVATAEYDPLRDEGEAYAAALNKADVRVIARRYPGLIHGFFGLGHISEGCRRATVELCADLKGLLA